jgi:HEAT repeat protein
MAHETVQDLIQKFRTQAKSGVDIDASPSRRAADELGVLGDPVAVPALIEALSGRTIYALVPPWLLHK